MATFLTGIVEPRSPRKLDSAMKLTSPMRSFATTHSLAGSVTAE